MCAYLECLPLTYQHELGMVRHHNLTHMLATPVQCHLLGRPLKMSSATEGYTRNGGKVEGGASNQQLDSARKFTWFVSRACSLMECYSGSRVRFARQRGGDSGGGASGGWYVWTAATQAGAGQHTCAVQSQER